MGSGTGTCGVNPMDVGGHLETNSCFRRDMRCHPKAFVSLVRTVLSELRECIYGQ